MLVYIDLHTRSDMSFLFDDFARCNATSQFQITRCAQNRLPHQQPAPAPNSAPTAIALRSPYCLPNFPGRPNAHPDRTTSPTPGPFAPPYPKKRHFCAPPVPSPASSNPTHVSPLHPSCAISPHQSRDFASPLEIYVHTCYSRPREGPTPRPGNPTPKAG